jgi:hypothetical protein
MITAIRDDAVANRRYLTTHLLCACKVKLPALLGKALWYFQQNPFWVFKVNKCKCITNHMTNVVKSLSPPAEKSFLPSLFWLYSSSPYMAIPSIAHGTLMTSRI